MDKITLKKAVDELENSFKEYTAKINKIENLLEDKISFEFGIEHQQSDCHVIINNETTTIAPLDECIKYILTGKKLTKEIHKSFAI